MVRKKAQFANPLVNVSWSVKAQAGGVEGGDGPETEDDRLETRDDKINELGVPTFLLHAYVYLVGPPLVWLVGFALIALDWQRCPAPLVLGHRAAMIGALTLWTLVSLLMVLYAWNKFGVYIDSARSSHWARTYVQVCILLYVLVCFVWMSAYQCHEADRARPLPKTNATNTTANTTEAEWTDHVMDVASEIAKEMWAALKKEGTQEGKTLVTEVGQSLRDALHADNPGHE